MLVGANAMLLASGGGVARRVYTSELYRSGGQSPVLSSVGVAAGDLLIAVAMGRNTLSLASSSPSVVVDGEDRTLCFARLTGADVAGRVACQSAYLQFAVWRNATSVVHRATRTGGNSIRGFEPSPGSRGLIGFGYNDGGLATNPGSAPQGCAFKTPVGWAEVFSRDYTAIHHSGISLWERLPPAAPYAGEDIAIANQQFDGFAYADVAELLG